MTAGLRRSMWKGQGKGIIVVKGISPPPPPTHTHTDLLVERLPHVLDHHDAQRVLHHRHKALGTLVAGKARRMVQRLVAAEGVAGRIGRARRRAQA